jgi:D-glycerate 3-kinase
VKSKPLQTFIQQQKLPEAYAGTIHQWFDPLANRLVKLHQHQSSQPLIVGIHGCQGSGKSTLSHLLCQLIQDRGLQAVELSLDDFYLTQQQRQQLAQTTHPLLATRGVPGTHDIELALQTLTCLKQGSTRVSLPRFNKAIDDREPQAKWPQASQPIDIIILEGWCLGAPAQTPEALISPVNILEETEDCDGRWRHYVNQQLRTEYHELWAQVNYWIMLQAPDFDCVYRWRLEQEEKLRNQCKNIEADTSGLMDADAIKRFTQHYERLTRHSLQALPAMMDEVFELDNRRSIVAHHLLSKKNQ